MKNKLRSQRGFLMIAAIITIIIFSLLASGIVSTFMRSSNAVAHLQAISAASALAESGLEQARNNLSITDLSSRQTCVGLSSTVTLTTGTSTTGRASNSVNNPRYAYATLATAITSASSPTTLAVNDTSVFSPDGWVMIGREVFQYDYIVDATTLGGVKRAQDSSYATTLPVGATVSQYQCAIAGLGQSPASNPLSTREYQQGMRQPVLFAAGQNGSILRWNGETDELHWAAQTSGTTLNLYGISALNYHSAWAVGAQSGSGFSFSRLQGSSWTNLNVALGHETDLTSVDATSTNEAWAVGKRTGSNTTILRWVRNASNDSANWCNASWASCTGISLSEAGVQNAQKDLYAVKTYDLNGDGYADVGFAAGGSHDASGKIGVAFYYANSQWTPIDKAPLSYTLPANTSEILGLDITRYGNNSPREVFFVGHNALSGGRLLRLRIVSGAANWTTVDTAQSLNAVSVIDTDGDGLADFGCAVGDNGYVITFDGSLTTTITNVATAGNAFRSVTVISSNDIWAVGDAGVRYHFDGSTWTSLTANVTSTNSLYSLSGVFPKQTKLSRWYELIN